MQFTKTTGEFETALNLLNESYSKLVYDVSSSPTYVQVLHDQVQALEKFFNLQFSEMKSYEDRIEMFVDPLLEYCRQTTGPRIYDIGSKCAELTNIVSSMQRNGAYLADRFVKLKQNLDIIEKDLENKVKHFTDNRMPSRKNKNFFQVFIAAFRASDE